MWGAVGIRNRHLRAVGLSIPTSLVARRSSSFSGQQIITPTLAVTISTVRGLCRSITTGISVEPGQTIAALVEPNGGLNFSGNYIPATGGFSSRDRAHMRQLAISLPPFIMVGNWSLPPAGLPMEEKPMILGAAPIPKWGVGSLRVQVGSRQHIRTPSSTFRAMRMMG